MDLGPIGHDAEDQLGFGDELVADEGRRAHPRQRLALRPQRDLEPKPVARHDLPPKLGVVHAAQVDAGVGGRILALQQQNRRGLRQRFQHQHRRHQRRARKVALEELLVHRDVLHGDETLTGVVLGNPVHQHGRKPVAQPVEQDGDLNHGRQCRMQNAQWPMQNAHRLIQHSAVCILHSRHCRIVTAWPAPGPGASRAVARPPPGASRAWPVTRRRLRRHRVQLLDDVGRHVETRIGQDDAGVGAAEQHLQPFLAEHLLHERQDLLLELELQLLLELADLGLRVLLEALALARLPLDVLLELRPRRIAHHRAALRELLLIQLELLGLLPAFGLLLRDQRVDLGREALTVDGLLRHALEIDVGDLRAGREHRGRCAGAAAAGAAGGGPRPAAGAAGGGPAGAAGGGAAGA